MTEQVSQKRKLTLSYAGREIGFAWYPGTSQDAMVDALRQALDLPTDAAFSLRDEDGDVIVLSPSLPDGLALQVELGEQEAPPASRGSLEVRGPAPYPLLGNVPQIGSTEGLLSKSEGFFTEFGDLFRLLLPGGHLIYVTRDADVVADLQARPNEFIKQVSGMRSPLANLREHSVGQGLFTADDTEEEWHIAHRILLPSFGLKALKQYFSRMREVCDDLVAYFGRLGEEPVKVTDAMTQMTFEAISYACFSERFGTIGAQTPHPFVEAMNESLEDAMNSMSSILPDFFHPIARRKRERADATMFAVGEKILRARKEAMDAGEAVPNDILQTMISVKDRQTGKRLPDENIIHQLLTLIVAGHETTSGMLSYALYHLATNPEVERRLIEEVDEVFGRDFSYTPTFKDVEQLPYTLRVLKEALRINPTAQAFLKMPVQDTVLAGRYAVKKGSNIMVQVESLHRNPAYWGDDVTTFEPDRFLPEAVAARHPHAYHPFGLGMRSCIGFQFALIEARLVLAKIYQRFQPRLADPAYQLRHALALTVKPEALLMKFVPRPEDTSIRPASERAAKAQPQILKSPLGGGHSFQLLYGSNMGASQDLASTIARQASARGLSPVVGELDEYVDRLSVEMPLVVVCSTYNGLPPDNAVKFAQWLEEADTSAKPCEGLRYAVLGCGNRQWRNTFQKFPSMVEERLQALGGAPLCERGSCDADGAFEDAADAWIEALWEPLLASLGADEAVAPVASDGLLYEVSVSNFAGAHQASAMATSGAMHGAARTAEVLVNRELQSMQSTRSTRHIEVALPEGMRYKAGDHLAVYPENPTDVVDAVAAGCGLRGNDTILLQEREGAHLAETARLPTGVPIKVRDLLSHHVDLVGPITRRELRMLKGLATCPPEQKRLEALCHEEAFQAEIAKPCLSFVDLFARFPSVPWELALLLTLRPVLKPRFYSISSSPRVLEESCSITVGVHTFGQHEERQFGLCSTYLAHCPEGTALRVQVKDTGSSFQLPADPTKDIILIGAGTGLAPMRGFLQERHAQRQEGLAVGHSYLFFGCRHPEHDYIYQDELANWREEGTLDGLFTAFSRMPEQPKVYVQDRLREEGATVWKALQKGATVYVCGDAQYMAPGVTEAITEICTKEGQLSAEEAQHFVAQLRENGHYLEDVWASSS